MLSRPLCALLAICLLAAASTARADADPELDAVCAGDVDVLLAVEGGAIVGSSPNASDAAAAYAQLAQRVAEELHKGADCRVIETQLEVACATAVEAGSELPNDSTLVQQDGTLYDMQIVEKISCPDGSFKVRYEARGIQAADSAQLENMQTRFIDVFDSSYTTLGDY